MSATLHYELEYRAGDRWFPATDGDGRVIVYDNVSAAYDALAIREAAATVYDERTAAADVSARWRIVSVDTYRRELPIPPK